MNLGQSIFVGLLVTCTSLIIYEIGKVKEEVAKSSSESSCDRQNESTGTPMLCGGDQTDRQGYEDYIV